LEQSKMIEPRQRIKILHRHKDLGSDRSAFMRLDKNERTIPFYRKIYKDMLKTVNASLLPMYPDQQPLYQKLARFFHLAEDYFLLSAGSDAAIKMIFETYIEPEDEVILLDPTYAMVEVYANMFGANQVKVGYDSELNLDFSNLIGRITSQTKMVILANPNQPTGTILTQTQIVELLKKAKATNTLVVLDEAYQPFSGQDSAAKYVCDYDNLIVVQTFSKALGLASLRLGFLVSQPVNLNYLYRVKTHSDINLFAAKFGEYLLDHFQIVDDYVESIQKSKQWLAKKLKKMGLVAILGHANFIHIKFPAQYDLKVITTKLKQNKFLVRVAGDGLPAALEGCMRITLGPPNQMKEFVRALELEMSDVQ